MNSFIWKRLEAVLVWMFVMNHMNVMKLLPSLHFSRMNFELSFVPKGLISGLRNGLQPQLGSWERDSSSL